MISGVRITVHFHGGTTAVTTLTDQDIEDACEQADVEELPELIEQALTYAGKPTFRWLGDIYLHPQAVTGVELLDLPQED